MTDALKMAEQAMNGELPTVNIEPVALSTPTSSGGEPALASSKPKTPFFTKEKLKVIATNRWFRYMLLFVIISILLLALSPPFVQQRRKNQSPLEKAPTSYKRVLIAATLTTGVVVLSPLLISHKAKFLAVAGKIKKMF